MHAHHVYPLDSDFVWCVPELIGIITTEESEELPSTSTELHFALYSKERFFACMHVGSVC